MWLVQRATVATFALVVSCPAAVAQSADRSSPYWLGVSAGTARLGDDRCHPELYYVREPSVCDDRDTGYKLYAGRTLNDYLAAEMIVASLGEAFFQTSIATRSGQVIVPVAGAHELSVGFAAVARMPVNRLDLYLKFGIQWWDRALTVRDEPSGVNTDGFDLVWGLGGQYPVSSRLDVRVELERFVIDDYDLNYRSVGIVWHF